MFLVLHDSRHKLCSNQQKQKQKQYVKGKETYVWRKFKKLRGWRSRRGSKEKEGMHTRLAYSVTWIESPLLSPQPHMKPPTTCSSKESIICTVTQHTHTHHTCTTTILCVFRAIKGKHFDSDTDTHTHTESFIILLIAAISISCAFNAPTSTALPVG